MTLFAGVIFVPYLTKCQKITRVCFPIFCISTILAVILAIVAIWSSPASESLWKLFGSAVVFVLASALTLSVIRAIYENEEREP